MDGELTIWCSDIDHVVARSPQEAIKILIDRNPDAQEPEPLPEEEWYALDLEDDLTLQMEQGFNVTMSVRTWVKRAGQDRYLAYNGVIKNDNI
jgi:hypothetical protein